MDCSDRDILPDHIEREFDASSDDAGDIDSDNDVEDLALDEDVEDGDEDDGTERG